MTITPESTDYEIEEAAQAAVDDALAGVFRAAGRMVESWVLQADSMDTDGGRYWHNLHPPEQHFDRSLALSEWQTAYLRKVREMYIVGFLTGGAIELGED